MAFGKISTFLCYDFVNFRPIGVISINNVGGANTFKDKDKEAHFVDHSY